MNSVFSTLLQAEPNAGFMQLFLLIVLIGIVLLVRLMPKKNKKNELNASIDNSTAQVTSSTNVDAGLELVRAGKNLVAATVILICTILGNYVYFLIYNDKVERDFSFAKDYFENLKILAYVDLGVFIIILGLMYMGFYALRVAGEKLANIRS
jgi:hypothetical protein